MSITGDISGTMTGGSLLFLRGGSTNLANHVQGSLNLTGANLAKTDGGTWTVGSIGETYSWNNTQVSVGTLRLNVDDMLTPARTISIGQGDINSATLDLNGTNQTTAGITFNYNDTSVPIAATGKGTINTGVGTLTLNGNLTYNGTASQTNGTSAINGNLDLGGGTRTFTINNGGQDDDFAINAVISNGALTKAGAGNLVLGGANTFTGATLVNAGILSLNAVDALDTTSAVTIASGATLRANDAAGSIIGDTLTVTVNTGGTFELDKDETIGVLAGNGTVAAHDVNSDNTSADTWTLTVGQGDADSTFSGVLQDDPGDVKLGLSKIGAGTITLSGASTYSGDTTVTTGTLSVTNTTGSATGASAVTIATGTSLIGTGSIDGTVTAQDGAFVAPGLSGIDAINTGDLTLDAGSTFEAELGAAPSSDQLVVTGSVTLNNADLDLIVTPGFIAPALSSHVFTLIDNNGSDPVIGTFNGLAEGNIISINSGGSANDLFRISYKGGDGNDVVLMALGEQATTSAVIDSNGDLVISDVDETNPGGPGSNSADRLTIFVDPLTGELVVRDPDNVLGTLANGATQTGLHEIRFAAGLFNDVIINTGDADDTVTFGSLTGLPGSISVDGGDGFDRILLNRANSTLAADANATFSAEKISLDRSRLSTSGTGSILFEALGGGGSNFSGLSLTNGSSLAASGSGDITLRGQGGDSGNGNHGVVMTVEAFVTSGSGAITIEGTGGAGNGSIGVALVQTHLTQTDSGATDNDDISVTGQGGGSATGSGNHGVSFGYGTQLTALGEADILVTGTAGDGSGGGNRGISIWPASAGLQNTLNTAGGNGDITLIGFGGDGGSGNTGILLSANLTAGGDGDILIEGTGGDGSGSNTGITLNLATVQAADGAITVTGSAGNGASDNYGLTLSSTLIRQTSASTAAAIQLTGTGRSNGAGSFNRGIAISGYSRVEALNTGTITLLGQGGAGTSQNVGVALSQSSSLKSQLGTIDVTGIGGAGSTTFNRGIVLNGSGVNSTAGSVLLKGNGGAGTNYNEGILVYNSQVRAFAALTMRGTSTGSGSNNHGVSLSGSSLWGGTGMVDIQGTGSGAGGRGIFSAWSFLNGARRPDGNNGSALTD